MAPGRSDLRPSGPVPIATSSSTTGGSDVAPADIAHRPHAGAAPLVQPTFYLRALPNVGIKLLATENDKLPTVFFAADGRGHEVLIENLPGRDRAPIRPDRTDDESLPEDGDLGDFSVGDEDSLAILKARDPQPSAIRTHVRLHLRPDGDVIFEPNTPVSIDGARLSGFPVEALYDVLLIPSPRRREYFEWARNDLSSFIDNPPAPGAIGIRAISVALDKPPFKALVERFRDNSGVHSEHVDLVLEDVVIPVTTGIPFPIPSHGTFGLRRRITDRNDIAQAYSLQNAPFRMHIGGDFSVFVDQLLFRSGSTVSDTDEAPVLELQAGVIWQDAPTGPAAGTLGIADDWTLQLGITLGDTTPVKLTIADVEVALHAVRGGVRLRALEPFDDAWQALGDFSLKSTSSTTSFFQVQSVTGKPLSVVLRDVGYSFGHFTLGKSVAMPEGAQLVFGSVKRTASPCG